MAVSETDHQDLWQRATLTAALTGGSLREADRRGRQGGALAGGALPGMRARASGLVMSVAELQATLVRNVSAGRDRMADGRMRRVDEAVRAVLSDAIAKDLQDPRVGFVTVTGVKTSPDLRHARVYVSVLGDEQVRAATASRACVRRTASCRAVSPPS